MQKSNLTLTLTMIFTVILICILFLFASTRANSTNIEFLKKYSWEVSPEPIEKVDILIPETFDEVYLNYNKLQIEAGLDLNIYRGYPAIRYTYRVLNFPEETKHEVRANVICVDGVPVAGDICTVAVDGFMYSLNFNVQDCISYSKSIHN